MKQVLIRQGVITVETVPEPRLEPGAVLISTTHSCISVGTEMSGVRASGTPLWKRALRQPEKVGNMIGLALSQGPARAFDIACAKLGAYQPSGYSAAGVVIAVGAGVVDLAPGDRVACAGNQCAFHAETICVPRNLTARIPDAVDGAAASTVALGAIALHGVRRLDPTIGETFVVLGLGLIGQIAQQILRANGCRVIGVDLNPARIEIARTLGLDATLDPDATSSAEAVARLTDGVGADGVLVAASADAPDLLAAAFRMCRKKGRVVLVGDVPIAIDRAEIYAKELEFRISTSYGPGRYDRRYEEEGADYPVDYVRWTENRNMEAYLRLLADGKVHVEPLIGAHFPIERAAEAYAALSGPERPLAAVLDYPPRVAGAHPRPAVARTPAQAGVIGLAVVGAGDFARAVHLPNIRALSDLCELRAVVARQPHHALDAARQFGAAEAMTDFDAMLSDDGIHAVIIATRHDSHAPFALAALKAGKHVFVEKPLALERDELAAIESFYADNRQAPVLMTGFNRRFSPFIERQLEMLKGRTQPLLASYRVNAGLLPANHWTQGPQGGGRNRGEACHFYDLFTALADASVTQTTVAPVAATGARVRRDENFAASFAFADGSAANLVYTALGARETPKERMELFCEGRTFILDDYRTLAVQGGAGKGLSLRLQDKGHKSALCAFLEAALGRRDWPIPLWQQIQATRMALEVERLLDAGPDSDGE